MEKVTQLNNEQFGRKPKKTEVGSIDGEKVFQLEESIGCLDCFRSIPAGSLVTIKNVSTDLVPIPVCMWFSGDKVENLKLTSTLPVRKCTSCSCPAFQDGTVKGRENYAGFVRKMRGT